MEIANVIDAAGILAQKAQWEKDYQQCQANVAKLQQDIVQVQNQMQALSGACQACDVFLGIMQTSLVPTAVETGPDNDSNLDV